MGDIPADVLETARSETKGLMLAQLKLVVRAERLPVSGTKNVLQNRIIDRLDHYARIKDMSGFQRLKSHVSSPEDPPRDDVPGNSSIHTPRVAKQVVNGGSFKPESHRGSPAMYYDAQGQLNFRESPFYHIQSSVSETLELKARESTRDTLRCQFTLRPELSERILGQENLKILIYCAPEPSSAYAKVDIAFPAQIEIKVNDNEVKANLRGLKQRPGSTRPADITNLVHKRSGNLNHVTVTYALTTKKYFLVVNLVHQTRPETLVHSLYDRPRILKQQVLSEMRRRASDMDIQATSSIMSLKCPLSTLRMSVPCRSIDCTHYQCYDALSYFQLQEQAPTWVCPVCNKPAPFDRIRIDEYVEDILKSTSASTESVRLDPNGDWSKIESSQTHNRNSGDDNYDGGDSGSEDLVEISELPNPTLVGSDSPRNSAVAQTPQQSYGEQTSALASIQRSGGVKRASAVIDLTLSDDEDHSPRPAKRRAGNMVSDYGLYSSIPGDSSSTLPGLSFRIPKTGAQSGRSFGY